MELAVEADCCELVSVSISLVTGNLQGNSAFVYVRIASVPRIDDRVQGHTG
jgi:hypothetical protein